jgi:hypothetical protein
MKLNVKDLVAYIQQDCTRQEAQDSLRSVYKLKFSSAEFNKAWRAAKAHIKRMKANEDKPLAGGRIAAPDKDRKALTEKRFVFTSAQNNTYIHEGFWASLLKFCEYKGAKLCVSKYSYNKNGWRKNGGLSQCATEASASEEGLWYDTRIEPYVLNEATKVANGLIFCGELDILPTAKMPLSGLDNYTGPNSAIVPHAKLQMQSCATMKNDPAKFLYTTGTCTLRNYIERKAGQIATFHHVFGALYVEIDDDGDWFARQLNADGDGSFYDLDKHYSPIGVSNSEPPIVTLGDIHVEKLDPQQLAGALDMLRMLKPRAVFLHDLIDFEARNHHNKKDELWLVDQHYNRDACVEHGLLSGARFLATLRSELPDATLYSVRSNHDEAFTRWVREGTPYPDPVNTRFWHECRYKWLLRTERGLPHDPFAYAMTSLASKAGLDISNTIFLKEDDSHVEHDIEFAVHGHLGPNGSRGSPKSFRQIGRRANTAHTHSAGIIDGIYTAGVLASLCMGYNKGPSSWSCSHVLTLPNGKRSIITQRGSKWRAN